MLIRFKMTLLVMKIEFHWLLIARKRKTGTQILNRGIPVSSPQMLRLSDNLNKHIYFAEAARKRYEALTALQQLAATFQAESDGKHFSLLLGVNSLIHQYQCFTK
jgi:hypothetical protein